MSLKALRIEKKMTVQQLADAAGLSKRTVEDILRREDCSLSNAIMLAKALGVTLNELCITITTLRLQKSNHVLLYEYHKSEVY